MENMLCMAPRCNEPRSTSSHCSQHTRQLLPIYLRYKRLSDELPNISTSNEIKDLMNLYHQYARVYWLRREYRHRGFRLEYQDWGHGEAIDRVWKTMQDLDQKMQTLTSIPLPPLEESNEVLEDEEVTNILEEDIVQLSQLRKTHLRMEQEELWSRRIPCMVNQVHLIENRLTQVRQIYMNTVKFLLPEATSESKEVTRIQHFLRSGITNVYTDDEKSPVTANSVATGTLLCFLMALTKIQFTWHPSQKYDINPNECCYKECLRFIRLHPIFLKLIHGALLLTYEGITCYLNVGIREKSSLGQLDDYCCDLLAGKQDTITDAQGINSVMLEEIKQLSRTMTPFQKQMYMNILSDDTNTRSPNSPFSICVNIIAYKKSIQHPKSNRQQGHQSNVITIMRLGIDGLHARCIQNRKECDACLQELRQGLKYGEKHEKAKPPV